MLVFFPVNVWITNAFERRCGVTAVQVNEPEPANASGNRLSGNESRSPTAIAASAKSPAASATIPGTREPIHPDWPR